MIFVSRVDLVPRSLWFCLSCPSDETWRLSAKVQGKTRYIIATEKKMPLCSHVIQCLPLKSDYIFMEIRSNIMMWYCFFWLSCFFYWSYLIYIKPFCWQRIKLNNFPPGTSIPQKWYQGFEALKNGSHIFWSTWRPLVFFFVPSWNIEQKFFQQHHKTPTKTPETCRENDLNKLIAPNHGNEGIFHPPASLVAGILQSCHVTHHLRLDPTKLPLWT